MVSTHTVHHEASQNTKSQKQKEHRILKSFNLFILFYILMIWDEFIIIYVNKLPPK